MLGVLVKGEIRCLSGCKELFFNGAEPMEWPKGKIDIY
jgi:hypothetical protein